MPVKIAVSPMMNQLPSRMITMLKVETIII